MTRDELEAVLAMTERIARLEARMARVENANDDRAVEAKALRDAADWVQGPGSANDASRWLRERADRIEAGS